MLNDPLFVNLWIQKVTVLLLKGIRIHSIDQFYRKPMNQTNRTYVYRVYAYVNNWHSLYIPFLTYIEREAMLTDSQFYPEVAMIFPWKRTKGVTEAKN